jgi:hypothetical protein
LDRVNTRDPLAVAAQVRADFRAMYPAGNHAFVSQAFVWAIDCFTGRDPQFLPIDARYHDLEHTLQGALCLSTLLRGRAETGAEPPIPQPLAELCLLAILLHDTGYLKQRSDTAGTGAKYTLTHVQRSCEFAERLLLARGFTPAQVQSVQNMIRCTGMGANVGGIPFAGEAERLCGYALGTADLLGQMAARDYVDKLPILFEEFVESGKHNGSAGAVGFSSAEDLMRKTPVFWDKYVQPKIQGDFRGLYRFLANAAGTAPNEYLARIESNLARLRDSFALAA